MKLTTLKAFALLMAVALISCANLDRDRRTASNDLSLATYTPVTTQAAAADTLEKWEDRLARLKKSSIGASTKDRHSKFEKRISRIDGDLEDGRSHFYDLKLADTDDKKKYFDKLNDVFEKVTREFNAALAE